MESVERMPRSIGGTTRRSRRGFTLMELMMVVVILGILAALLVPQFVDSSTTSQASTMGSTVRYVRQMLQFHRNSGEYQVSTSGWPAQISQQWFRGDSLPLHPWTGDAVVIEIVDGASTEVYPAQKIFDASDSMAANCWYNRTNGSFCARVGAAGTNAQTLELFNAANLCSAGSMTQTTQ